MQRKTISKLLPAILCACTLAGCGTQNDTKQMETEMVATESIKETIDIMSEVESETVTETKREEVLKESDEALDENALYDALINGTANVDSLPESVDFTSDYYEILDIDNDGRDEMFLETGDLCYVIDNDGKHLAIIYEGTVYEKLINTERLKGIGYYRAGGAPTHETYQFTTFSKNSEVDKVITFERYDDNEDGVYDENDIYIYEEQTVTNTEWEEKTKDIRESILATQEV